MRKTWWLYIGFLVFTLALYFGTDLKSKEQRTLEKSRVLVKKSKNTQVVLRDAYHAVKASDRQKIDEIQVLLDRSVEDEQKRQWLVQLSSLWFTLGHYDAAGHFAERVAEMTDDGQAWSLAGTTYSQGIRMALTKDVKQYCADKARNAFDQAKLIQPINPEVELNSALTFVFLPDEGNPMQGIQMLLEVKSKYPQYGPVYRQLGSLAIQTGQYKKAVERLRTAYQLEEDKKKSSCLLSEAFTSLHEQDSAQYYNLICNN